MVLSPALLLAATTAVCLQNDEVTSTQDNKVETASPATWVDPFERGPLPTLACSLDNNPKDEEPETISHQSSISVGGEYSADFPGDVSHLEVEIIRPTELERERVFGVSAPLIRNRQFVLTAMPPAAGWPVGKLLVRVTPDHLQVLSKEYTVQIVDNRQPVAALVDEDADEEVKLVEIETARVNMTIDPDRVRKLPYGMPVRFCGRLPKSDVATCRQLLISVNSQNRVYSNGLVTLLEDGDEVWFETILNLTGRELRQPKLTAELKLPSGGAPGNLVSINLEILPIEGSLP